MKHDATPAVPVQVDRESVRQLAIQIGVRPAARQLGLSEDRVRQWSKREQWFAIPQQPPSKANVTVVTKPGDLLLQSIAGNISQARARLAEVARKSADKVKVVTVESAKELRDLAGTIQQLGPSWEARNDQAAGLAVNILIVNGDMEP